MNIFILIMRSVKKRQPKVGSKDRSLVWNDYAKQIYVIWSCYLNMLYRDIWAWPSALISSWDDMKARVVRMYSDWSEEKWRKNRKIDFWHECLYKTLNLFPKDKVAFWEPHIWSPINKYKHSRDEGCSTEG